MGTFFAGCGFILFLIVLSVVLSTSIIYFSWNLIIAPIFGIAMITWWMALLLGALIGVIGSAFQHSSSKD